MDANTNAQDQGTQTPADTADTNGEERKLYATREDAEKDKPAKAGKHAKVYTATKGGTVLGYIWANGYGDCNTWASRREGYVFSTGNSPAVTKEAVAAKLADFSDDELQALGLARKPQRGKK
jgi:hypothetical protein